MPPSQPGRIVLVGLPGSGKTAVARHVARALGWEAIDLDDAIVAADGRDISTIFREDGEAGFRQRERAATERVATRERVVIATGGGAVLDPSNRAALWRDAFVVHLQTRPATLLRRIAGGRGGLASRPLLTGNDPHARLDALLSERGPLYALADWTVPTDGLRPADIAEEIAGAWERRSSALISRPERMEELGGPARPEGDNEPVDPDLAATVTVPGGSYPAFAGWDVLHRLPGWLRAAGLGPVVHVIADARVAELHGESLMAILAEGGFHARLHTLDLAEERKTLDSASALFDRLVAERAERKHVVLAFGGGVATDLGGFVAATYLRGLPLVQVPTTLLGMVDAAIGGKVAVNLPAGKNLVGAFYQPRLVVADAAVLGTLPRREFVSGWAEVIKHALIRDVELLDWLESEADDLLALAPEPASRVLRRSIRIKAEVVSADEREDGERMLLNYGHTTGHGLEAATGYHALLHGEAVAVGMVAAAYIGRALGMIGEDLVQRQNALIERFGLPTRAPGVPVDDVMRAMQLDKKVIGGALRFILLQRAGAATVRTDVPVELVREAVAHVTC